MYFQMMERQGWVYSASVDYKEMVKKPEFEGHTTRSLRILFNEMQECALKRFKLTSRREVTVQQVKLRMLSQWYIPFLGERLVEK